MLPKHKELQGVVLSNQDKWAFKYRGLLWAELNGTHSLINFPKANLEQVHTMINYQTREDEVLDPKVTHISMNNFTSL